MATTPNEKLLEAIMEAAHTGAIDEDEFEAEWAAAGGETVDAGSIEDMPDEVLVDAYLAAPKGKGMRAYLASLIVARGLTCGCEACGDVHGDALRWKNHVDRLDRK